MNPVSQLNLLAQQTNSPIPVYEFSGEMTEWKCIASYKDKTVHSRVFTNKKAAKHAAAESLLKLVEPTVQDKGCQLKDYAILVDGDQRSDCWKWLATSNLDKSVKVYVFISPTTPLIESKNNITVIVSKTTNRDSSDATLLVSLGSMLECLRTGTIEHKEILLVSADHIIVQAAQDFGCQWASNLQQLKNIELCEN
jgi:hypothetical protein